MALNENPTLVEVVNEIERLNKLIIDRGGAKTITPITKNQVLSKGDITVKGDSNLIPSNILSGKTIFGVTGSAKQATGNATASQVLSGYTFSNSTSMGITGTMANRGGAQTITPTTSNKTLSSGYYSGNITVKGDSNLVSSNIVSGKSIFGVSGSATVSSLGGKMYANGIVTPTTETKTFKYVSGTEGTSTYVTIPKSSIPFTPRYILVESVSSSLSGIRQSLYINDGVSSLDSCVRVSANDNDEYTVSCSSWLIDNKINTSTAYIIPIMYHRNANYRWLAFE